MNDLESFYLKLGSLIREKREAKGITQESLAWMVALSRTSITNIEKGRQKLLLHTFLDISSALELKPEALLPKISLNELEQTINNELEKYTPSTREWIKDIVSSREGNDL